MPRVMVFGTFDNLHPGHLSYFAQAANYGDEAIAVIARDQNVLKLKGKRPQEDEKTRQKKVKAALKLVVGFKSRAVLGRRHDHFALLAKYRPEFICLGYDQAVDMKALKRFITQSGFFCRIKKLKAFKPERYKSRYLRADNN